MMRGGLLIALGLLVPFAARSQTFDLAQFQTFLRSDANRGLVNRALSSIPAEVFHTCPNLVISKPAVQVSQSISFGPDGVPNAGAWWERFPVQGCGNDTVLNIRFVAAGDGTIDATATLPGSTRADPLLQRDATQYAYLAAGSRDAGCPQFYIKTSRFGGYGLRRPDRPDPGAKARFRPWWETWTVIGCGRNFDVLMEFVPDETGTRIIQPQAEISEY